MNSMRAIYHLACADFYERTRRYSFLVMIGLFGFYLVKGSVERDRETGVGQILATTPLTRPLYMLGKWFSNLAVLIALVAVLGLAGIVLQFQQAESTPFDPMAFLAPFLLIVLPLIALVAAYAVLFESLPFLRGSLGNIVYFVLFLVSIPLVMENLDSNYVVFEPLGFGLLQKDMSQALLAVYPDYSGGFSLGPSKSSMSTFTWTGIHWTPGLILARFTLIGLALVFTLLAALFFDRFDPSQLKPRPIRKAMQAEHSPSLSEFQLPAVSAEIHTISLTPIDTASKSFRFLNVLLAEWRMLLKGRPWWWYAIAGGLVFACLANPSAPTRAVILPLAWAWPLQLWSSLGSREIQCNVQQITFSSASPVWRQLPAQWLAGFLLALLVAIGALIRFLLDGDTTGLLALLSGAIFIPSLALFLGVWSGTGKPFEILYLSILYIGPFNHVPALDFIGTNGSGRLRPHPEE